MRMSPKFLMVGAAGAATLAFVGVGAGAAFDTTATVTGTASTGTAMLQASTSYGSGFSCVSDGITCGATDSNVTLTPGSASVDAGTHTSSLNLGTVANLGSQFTVKFPVTFTNSGSLTLNKGSVALATGPESGAGVALAAETLVTVTVGTHTFSNTLANFETAASSPIDFTIPNGLAPGRSVAGSVTLTPASSGGLDNSAEGATLSPTLTVTASDA